MLTDEYVFDAFWKTLRLVSHQRDPDPVGRLVCDFLSTVPTSPQSQESLMIIKYSCKSLKRNKCEGWEGSGKV